MARTSPARRPLLRNLAKLYLMEFGCVAATELARREHLLGNVAQSSPRHDCPLSRHSSADGFDLGPSEGREAVHDGDPDLDFGGLAVGVS